MSYVLLYAVSEKRLKLCCSACAAIRLSSQEPVMACVMQVTIISSRC